MDARTVLTRCLAAVMVAGSLSACANPMGGAGLAGGAISTPVIAIRPSVQQFGEPYRTAQIQALRQAEARWRTPAGITAFQQGELTPVNRLNEIMQTTITVLPPVMTQGRLAFGPAQQFYLNGSNLLTETSSEQIRIDRNRLCFIDSSMNPVKCLYALANRNGAIFLLDEQRNWVAVSAILHGDPFDMDAKHTQRIRAAAQREADRTAAKNFNAIMGGIWTLAMGAAAAERAAYGGRPPSYQGSSSTPPLRTSSEELMGIMDLRERIPVRTQFGYR